MSSLALVKKEKLVVSSTNLFDRLRGPLATKKTICVSEVEHVLYWIII